MVSFIAPNDRKVKVLNKDLPQRTQYKALVSTFLNR